MHGSCVCGACGFDVDLEPGTKFHACHCETCRRWTGSVNFSVAVAPGAIRFAPGAPIAARQTSDWAERTWCADCGSNLFYRLTVGPKAGWMYLALGLLDDPGAIPFGGEIYIDRKPDTYAFAGEHSRMTRAETEAMFAADSD